MRCLSSVVTALLVPAALGLSSARAEPQPLQPRSDAPSRTELRDALKSVREALLRLDRARRPDSPDVIRPDPEIDRGMEKRPPEIGAAMPVVVPRN